MSTHISDDEWLLRSFPVPDFRTEPPIEHYEIKDGQLRIRRSAFNDRNCTPSVDRESLVASPQEVVFNSSDAVIKLKACEVRSISEVPISNDDGSKRNHDCECFPTEDRPSHVLITSEPEFKTGNSEKKKFRILKEILAVYASKHGWVCRPGNLKK